MDEMTERIGTNAGLVWSALNESKKPMTYNQLKRATKLGTLRDVHLALGWLAKEGKLCFDESGDDVTITLK